MNSGAVAPQVDGRMCDFTDCEKWNELDCSQFRADIFLKPTCYRPLIGKTDDGATVPCSVGLSCVWISVKERLPEAGQIVLWWNDDVRMIEFGSAGSFNGENVTYWMPLPEPPPAR